MTGQASTLGALACVAMLSIAAPWTSFALTPDDEKALVQDGAGGDDEFSAHGFNVFRIEQEDKLLVPLEQREAVWEFLKKEFGPGSEFLAQDPLLTSYHSEEDFTDRYFDTPTLQLLAMQSGVRRRTRVNISNPNDRKSGRSLIQIKVNDISDNALERGEYKFKVSEDGAPKGLDGGHPFLGLVEADQRAAVKERLASIGIDAYALRPILTIHDKRRRVYVLREGKSFISISFDHVHSDLLWAKAELLEIEPELNEIAFTEASAETKQNMERIGAQVTQRILAAFPEIQRDLKPKSNKTFEQFESQIPMLRLLERFDLVNANGIFGLALAPMVLIVAGVVAIRSRKPRRR